MRKGARTAFEELVARTPGTLHVPKFRYVFEGCALLLDKFRRGRPMPVSETRQLKEYLGMLGLLPTAPVSDRTAKYFN